MDTIPTLKEVAESANELIQNISRHPAIIMSNGLTKKEDPNEYMHAVEDGNLLDQIDLACKLLAEIDDKIKDIYKSVKQSYFLRFPELKIADPMQYIITVQLLGNEPGRIADEDVKERLTEILGSKMYLLITMIASTTHGVKLEPEELEKITRGCSFAIHLTDLRNKLLKFVQSNMATIAPNLSAIVGALIAAKLMALAGGLTELANMPSCNLPILGSHKVSNIETNVNAPPRVGLIYECDLIQNIPFDHTKDVRKRAVKWVANKCILAARCDISKSDLNGNAGEMFRSQVENSINKELEPPPKKAARPLPAPIDKSGKKRGGKRVRRLKERYKQTGLRKAANRIYFGNVGDDEYQNDLGVGKWQYRRGK